jgi:hypothetical protein
MCEDKSDGVPICVSVAPCLARQGVAWKCRARGEPSATASLDGPCARCPGTSAGPDEGTASWHEPTNCTDEEPEMT